MGASTAAEMPVSHPPSPIVPQYAHRLAVAQRSLGNGEIFARNIENFVGTVAVPVGLMGPLLINGRHATGEYFVPLATTEATLVASYNRGARLIHAAGGCTTTVTDAGIQRAPGFAFRSLSDAVRFAEWLPTVRESLEGIIKGTGRFVTLRDLEVRLEGNLVFTIFTFGTGDAAGQNMVTIATEAALAHLRAVSPVRPLAWVVESNASGDKKACAMTLLRGRGRMVSAEAIVPARVVERQLRATPEEMAAYCRLSSIGAALTGTLGAQGHFANGLTALFIACGQDVACVAESATGITRMEVTDEGALRASVTLPALAVGTVGGGTGLPSQRASLEILGLAGSGCANALAEVCGALALAGELSIIGALVAHEFTASHVRLARGGAPRPVHSAMRHA